MNIVGAINSTHILKESEKNEGTNYHKIYLSKYRYRIKKHGKIYIEFWDEETGETCEIQTHCINQEEAKQILEKEGKDYIPPRLFLNEKIRLRKFMRKEGRTWAS